MQRFKLNYDRQVREYVASTSSGSLIERSLDPKEALEKLSKKYYRQLEKKIGGKLKDLFNQLEPIRVITWINDKGCLRVAVFVQELTKDNYLTLSTEWRAKVKMKLEQERFLLPFSVEFGSGEELEKIEVIERAFEILGHDWQAAVKSLDFILRGFVGPWVVWMEYLLRDRE
ncbi:MAG: hypothetical protein QXT45_05355 [Candidatus Bilamarchaeaceae archaeon]